jgi:hypothetical protein
MINLHSDVSRFILGLGFPSYPIPWRNPRPLPPSCSPFSCATNLALYSREAFAKSTTPTQPPLGPATPPATNPDPPTVKLTPAAPIAAASTTTARGTDPEEERMLQMALCATASVAPHAATPSEPPFPPPSLRTPIFPSPPSLSAPFTLPASASHPSPRASLRRTTAAKCADCGAFPSRCTCPPTSTPPLPTLLQPPDNSLPSSPPSSKDAVV